ncbi:HEPN domain-containing protein [Clostridium pasteurianum DSM 525 = ATCC 6013]|uniref:HEPN domain protein n=1 Tax=Clostridium pasteurianum DSM 525 = ATCC 6013 TaxID=1262449 RepID=A0A0H3J8H7_CLOPA|nr:HEPN domain-containing protein [Clostridium pasteurianum]AJA49522.1 HEPN domain-containing protein [Clostridium pasteurianum DSM 525 = ATCC 6013]AJA53510.1 HEPN domain-containing protein [Clostridium pasteurianum DSM 525 = ATCC 6013]AOZ76683.1 hypothetical protein AQ983_16815 [Clostridium pasteurianum DSM 525 = ATCC 6013]AOZ80480.1 hypothetical protein AQ984_16810 [Clostridium pasteurianum]ELP58959.1 HEPN domain-containing protein [Clostridium pasteurianum DSM 525 = ATCC 6013]
MVKKKELQKLSDRKLEELKKLYDARFYDSVVEQSGLVVEYGLKASICKNIKKDMYPEYGRYKIHEPEKLIDLANLRNDLELEKSNNIDFFVSWSLLSKWSVNFRYRPIGSSDEKESKEYIKALDDQIGGVHPWIRKHW